MVALRLKLFLKWGFLILLATFIVGFLVGLISGLLFGNNTQTNLITLATTALASLFFVYKFCYKATMEYLTGGTNRWQKGIGLSIGIGVAIFAALLGIILNYVVTRQFNGSIGLTFIIGWVAGSRAEKNFLSKGKSKSRS